jgi:hypothetical protein
MVAAGRSVALRLGCAAMIAAAIPATSAELKDPLSPLTSAKGSILCFRRDYSAGHLMQHPKQTTRSVLLAFQEQGLAKIVLSQRAGAQNRILAGCAGERAPGSAPPTARWSQFQQAGGIRLYRNGRGFS